MSDNNVLRAIELLERLAAPFDEACMLLRQVAMQQENEVKAVAWIVTLEQGMQILVWDKPDSNFRFLESKAISSAPLYLAPPTDKKGTE